ncbi:hypothetical protein BBJ28_00019118 [Nothophytophthora sp. Chile5]|nr:hypothetical protein BBJ28_00019118 [Nothophytophthora sp. Chile5]
MASPPASPSKSSASPSKSELVYKVILIGSAAVGKTNLLSVAARGQQFDERSRPTLQPEFVTGTFCCLEVKVQRPDWKFGEPNQFLRAQVNNSFKEIFQGVEGGSQWLRALKENADPALLAAVMLVENKADKLGPKTLERPPTFVQDKDVKKVLAETVFKEPAKGLGWLYDAAPSEAVPFRIANSLMFARTSAVTNQCELFELTEKSVPSQNFLAVITPKPSVEYEPSIEVKTVSQALEALVLRIYARSKDIEAGGSKPSGQTFHIHEALKDTADATSKDSCC